MEYQYAKTVGNLMKIISLSFLNLFTVLLILTGCSSGYMPVIKENPHASYNGYTNREIKLRNCVLSVWLVADEKDRAKFTVYFSIEQISKINNLILANLNVKLSEPAQKNQSFVLQNVHVRSGLVRIKDGQSRSILDSVWTDFKAVEIPPGDDGITYINAISYEFLSNPVQKNPRKLQVNIEASTEGDGKTETVKDSILFKQFHAIQFH